MAASASTISSRAAAVTSALERYATRGVFRGFSVHAARGGKIEYHFVWLMRRPMVLSFDPVAGALVFKQVFPGLGRMADVAAAVKTEIANRSSRALPAHKRLDGRKATVAAMTRAGDLSVVMTVRGAHQDYAVRMGLNLVNELFVLLHEHYPDYLTEHFGLPAE